MATESIMDDPLGRIHSGGEEAFEALVECNQRRVMALAIRLTGSVEDAKEVTQDAFVRLHANLHQFTADDQIQRWLRVVTVNLCRDAARRRPPVHVQHDATASARSAAPTPEADACSRETEAILQAALLRLTARERAALVLREFEELTTAEVADVMGVAEATVRVLIMQARLKLRKLLAGRLGKESAR